MISLYRPGTSILHRVSAGVKLAGLAIIALTASTYPHDGASVTVMFGLVIVLYAIARLPAVTLFRQVWQLRALIIVLALFLAVFVSPLAAWINTGRVVVIVLLAGLLTSTTRMGDLLELLQRMLRPLQYFGVNADAVAMTISLCIAMVPVIAAHATSLREAQQARNVRLGVRLVVPLLVMALRHADDAGDALAARGLA